MSTQNTHTHKQVLLKFLLLCLLMVGYFGYLSYEYDFVTGGVASLLTWSFFVLCTPVADAGFLLDFPLRVLFGIRMVVSEIRRQAGKQFDPEVVRAFMILANNGKLGR